MWEAPLPSFLEHNHPRLSDCRAGMTSQNEQFSLTLPKSDSGMSSFSGCSRLALAVC